MGANAEKSFSLIEALLNPELYTPPAESCRLIETHISWVILAGDYAYKIKKPLDLGFLDFSTLEKRHFYCQEELRLNKRLAPEIYLGVEPITGTAEHPEWNGNGETIEYAVKMRAFPQESQLDRMLEAGLLEPCHMVALAGYIAEFHTSAPQADQGEKFGTPETLHEPVTENFSQIREHVRDNSSLSMLRKIESWSNAGFNDLQPLFKARKQKGYIRECHGDLHLRNIGWVENKALVFDCIEFAPQLRWIDVICDVAFLVMDLEDRNQKELAYLFLNRYLERTGDYPAVQLLKYYLVYRAMVRAKVEAIRMEQPGSKKEEQSKTEQSFHQYLQLAYNYTLKPGTQLIITRGMSASGKSTISEALLQTIGAIRIRSDVERKRLHGLQADDNGQTAVGKGLYSPEATEKTYKYLAKLAALIIDAGFPVIIDGVFMHYRQRKVFQDLAEEKAVPYTILECRADIKILRDRIATRKKGVSDAGVEVLEMQYRKWQELEEAERACAVIVDTAGAVDMAGILARVRRE